MTGVRIAADATVPAADRHATWLSYAYAVLVGVILGHFLLGIPIQLTDSFGNMAKLSTPWTDLLSAEFTQHAYLRPMLWAELKLVYDASGGDFFSWFRGTHVVQVIALVVLYVALVRPRTFRDAALIPFGLAVLIGSQTFAGTIREAFPINTFLTVLLFCFAATHLALARYRWWHDMLALLLFAAAALTVESGLLVWVIFVGAWLVGARGVSRIAIVALVVLLAGYFSLRFAVLEVGAPNLLERSSGFGFSILEPDELTQRFGQNPIGFYVYNIAASMLSVLTAEPTAGVFRATAAVLRGDIPLSTVLNLIATTSVTLLVARFAWRRRELWRARRFDRDDQLVLLFGMVLVANAVISYPYTKDVIMSPAGALFAVAGFVAARHACASMPDWTSPRHAVAIVACAALVSGAWATRFAAAHLDLRSAAYAERNDWAYAEGMLDDGRLVNPADRALFQALRDEAIYGAPAPPPLDWPLRAMFREP